MRRRLSTFTAVLAGLLLLAAAAAFALVRSAT
jgi:hypothetical protein